MKFIKEHGFAMFLGGVLIVVGVNIMMWEWWVILVPTIFLVQWRS
jgi:hypothetical protein